MSLEQPAFAKFEIAEYPNLKPALMVKVNADPHRREVQALIDARADMQYFNAQLALFDVAGYASVDFLEVLSMVNQLAKTFSGVSSGVINLQPKSIIEAKLSARALPMLKIFPIIQGTNFDKETAQIEKRNPQVAELIRAYQANTNPVVLLNLLGRKAKV